MVYPDSATFVIARADDTTFGILHSRFHELWSLRLCTYLGVGNDPRYTPTTTFETFPFPEHLTPRDTAGWGPGATTCDKRAAPAASIPPSAPAAAPVIPPSEPNATPAHVLQKNPDNATLAPEAEPNPAIAAAAKRLNELREAWLNPPEWVDWVRTPEEEQAGFPCRPVAKRGKEAELKKRTLTNLYNARPAWLDQAHKNLDAAVATAYGWTDYTPDMPDEEILRRLLALNLERSAGKTEKSETTNEALSPKNLTKVSN